MTLIASIARWFAISFANFYRVGDRVQLGGIKGGVSDIAILHTTLMEIGEWVIGDQYSGWIVQIANSFVFKEPVFNSSGDFPFLWDEIAVPIKNGSDHRLARQILQDVVDEEIGEYSRRATESWERMAIASTTIQLVELPALNTNLIADGFPLPGCLIKYRP